MPNISLAGPHHVVFLLYNSDGFISQNDNKRPVVFPLSGPRRS